MSSTLRDAVQMLLAGIGIPILAVLNSQLGARSGAPVAAGVVLFLVALAATAATLLASGQGTTLTRLSGQPWYLFLGGFFVAFYVLSVTWVAPRFGVGNAIFCVLLGQMVAASVIDQFGLFGAVQRPIDLSRGLGIAAMALGLALIQRG